MLFTVYFQKTFVGGNLDGLTVDDKITNASAEVVTTMRAREFTRRLVTPVAGSGQYRVHGVRSLRQSL